MSKGAIAGVLAVLAIAGVAIADPVFVGSWEVDQGPFWTTNPPVYSGQEAAALLFGGSPSDYSISTNGPDASLINHMAWGSTIFVAGGQMEPEGYSNVPGGTYDDGGEGRFSTYVDDNAVGPEFTNYAFRNTAVPVPGSFTLLLSGVACMGVAWRRSRKSAA